jgi:hypothetical protein
MKEATIRLCYRKIIDIHTTGAWENLVFEDTYAEFRMQAQLYNQQKKYTTFSELITHAPGAEQLHFLVSAAVTGYLPQLGGKIPDLPNALGKLFLPFNNFRFEIINSHIQDRSKHQVAINFFSDHLLWHDTIHNQLLLSVPGHVENGELLTELFTVPPFVSIYSLKQASYDTAIAE